MTTPPSENQADSLEKMRRQFDFGPYPRIPIDADPREASNDLFIFNLVTPYYLRNRRVAETAGKVILDAGCGTGYKALALAKANPAAKIVGIDLSPKSIELAQQRFAYHGYQDLAEFHVLSIEEVTQLGIQFDYINCDETLYFFDDIAQGLSAFKSVLKPEGIIRANLHSALQRRLFFQVQEFLNFIGLMEEDATDMAIPIFTEIMKSLRPEVFLKQGTGWNPKWEDLEEEANKELLLANHLLKGDKGYRISDMFDGIQRAGLEFISMVNWRHWNVEDLFQEPDNLPSYLAMGLAESTLETLLTTYELLHPVHRLLDFWCTHPRQSPELLPVAEWTLEDWLRSQVILHPQLRTEAFQKAALEAIQQNGPFMISTFLSLPTLSPVTLSYDVAALLLQLWDGPQPFTALVNFWQRIHPINLITLEPTPPESAAQQVADALGKLEVFLYVLPEQI
ncbi:class I SAM-dependent methyltransferase [Phormidium sp. FACHB-1136]|uniref:class I SAM-dependent methyltransferase n=1 Tax=Phormidium sp. FACHB-1136 TaxID=2692848 RepID=UPI0016837FB2|nr:class I SAM-dependent methyltransferase [Phormidium sp. FACHB-1136]MBD2424946.1 class I SAM-dependent methyltransferase [Phormidium sp. FACHB-1136]